MGFAWSSLSVRENSAIVPLDDLIDKVLSNWFVDFKLVAVGLEDIVEWEDFVFSCVSVYVWDEKLFFLDVEINVFG